MHHQKYHSLNFLRGSSSSTNPGFASSANISGAQISAFSEGLSKKLFTSSNWQAEAFLKPLLEAWLTRMKMTDFFLSHPRSLYSGRGLWRRCV